MILINFGSPLKPDQLTQAESLLHEPVDRTVHFPVQVDSNQPVIPQFEKLIKAFPLSIQEIRDEPIAVILPGPNYLAALVLSELHAWLDFFPPVLRMRLQPYGLLPHYEVVELLDIQAVEDSAGGRES